MKMNSRKSGPSIAAQAPESSEHSPHNAAPLLKLEHLTVSYGDTTAIRDANFEVAAGEVMALVGPSGCGKTSLLNSINRMTALIPGCRVQGRVFIGDRDTSTMDDMSLRRSVGMVFQKPNPFPMSIRENIQFPLREHGVRNRSELADITERVLRDAGLWNEVADRLNRSAFTLSGGQQQRLCIARALALEPGIMLFDEPCSALDPISSGTVEALIAQLKGRITVLMVTHNLAQARRVADTIAVCWVDAGCGCVIESGPTKLIFEAAKHPVAAAYCKGEFG